MQRNQQADALELTCLLHLLGQTGAPRPALDTRTLAVGLDTAFAVQEDEARGVGKRSGR